MAYLHEFGSVDEDVIFNYKIYEQTIDTLCGIIVFEIVEDLPELNGITIIGYEKSFWGKKQKGYVKLTRIEDSKLKIPDTLVGFEFWSVYDEVFCQKLFRHFKLGQPRKEVLSLDLLIRNIQMKLDAYNIITTDALDSSSDWLSDEVNSTINFSGGGAELYRNVLNRLKVFDKFRLKK